MRSTSVPLLSIACRAARMRSTARWKGYSGSERSSVESSIERPAIPVFVARDTLAATAAGSIAKPPSKSALTGRSTLSTRNRRWDRASSSDT